MPDTHDCPGRCGAQVHAGHFACKPCWSRLPGPHRDAISVAYRKRNWPAHRAAMRAARIWYQDQEADHA